MAALQLQSIYRNDLFLLFFLFLIGVFENETTQQFCEINMLREANFDIIFFIKKKYFLFRLQQYRMACSQFL